MPNLENISLTTVQNSVKLHIGEGVWSHLDERTKVDITTSELCFQTFQNLDPHFDFASAISPIMKGLELELRKVFYDGYIAYLKSHYTAEQYAHAIWAGEYPGDRVVSSKRNKILTISPFSSKLVYTKEDTEFTIGNFRFTIGANNISKIQFDKTIIEYGNERFADNPNYSEELLHLWLKYLVINLEKLRKIRNESSHSGHSQKKDDAETALNDLVKIKKLLGIIVCPNWDEIRALSI